jgi:lipopolysaccharide/colanic/teichoic acid biosynthesis glycosyltransferase
MMTLEQRIAKRGFDLFASVIGLAVLWPLILLCWVLASLDTGANGLFVQVRVGRGGKPFFVLKLRTMRPLPGTSVTTSLDPRITALGAIFRRFKVDELPQLWNVARGEMSIVGPRPDVPGFMDRLSGDQRRILTLRPGITGPATLKYREEEAILGRAADPELYNAEVIWPDKVCINLDYLDNWTFSRDLHLIWKTLAG